MTTPIRWGILGTGSIAGQFVEGLRALPDADVRAVGSRTLERAEAFGGERGIPNRHGSYEALASDPEVDVIYIATPHPMHARDSILCLEHGKHVVCEKPVTVNSGELEQVLGAAKASGKFFMEAMWMYFTPNIRLAESLVRDGAIGKVRMLTAHFGFQADADETSRLLNPDLAGGALLDVGIYPIAFALLMMGGVPKRMTSSACLGQTGVDEQSAYLFEYEDGAIAQLSSAVTTTTPYDAWILGDAGRIHVHAPFWGRCPGYTLYQGDDEEGTYVSEPLRGNGYDYEAEAAMQAIRDGLTEHPRMPHRRSQEFMATMDALRAQWGLRYPFE